MDFSKELMQSQGHGNYSLLKAKNLPFLFLAYLSNPSDSGKIHSNVRELYDAGDATVKEAMQKFADLTVEAKSAILDGNWENLADLMEKNFSLRRSIYGDACLGDDDLKMIEIGRKFGAACKFPGSGGAILGLLKNPDLYRQMHEEYLKLGCVVVKVNPNC